ncbi:MAG: hypothetical protein AAF329_19645 [Cyanobacteria bacterium P01_A01_bin.17]
MVPAVVMVAIATESAISPHPVSAEPTLQGQTAKQAGTRTFTIRAGALIEAIYFNVPSNGEQLKRALLPSFQKAVAESGGEYLASFEVLKNAKGDHTVTHIALMQWPNSSVRAAAKNSQSRQHLNSLITDVGFFAAQQDTPVVLSQDKIYDFTSAWTIATEPAHMQVVMQVLGTYFQKIGPVTQKYGITTTAFLGRHPAAPQDEARVFAPDISGIFEWQNIEDHSKFNRDPMFTEHVDIRNAVLRRTEEVLITKVIL